MPIPKNITKDHIIEALKRIDGEGVPEKREVTKFSLVYEGKHYPPKYVISTANIYANGELYDPTLFSGGEETNRFFRSLGLTIISNAEETSNNREEFSLRNNLFQFMDSFSEAYKISHRERVSRTTAEQQLMDSKISYFREIRNFISGLPFIEKQGFIVKSSVGQGRFTKTPYLGIRNPEISDSIQKGVYMVYLFSEDYKRLYLTISQGTEDKTVSVEERELIKNRVRAVFHGVFVESGFNTLDEIGIGNQLTGEESDKSSQYRSATISFKEYALSNLPSNNSLLDDLEDLVSIYASSGFVDLVKRIFSGEDEEIIHVPQEEIKENKGLYMSYTDLASHIHSYIKNKGFYYKKKDVINLFLSLKSKPFVIISGISGTGKTKIVELFAESVGATSDNKQFTLIPVRPDWSDSSDLIGYYDISQNFQEGPMLKVIKNALAQPDKPYFVLLDEMNLARVEHYFSDFLSIIESRKRKGNEIKTIDFMELEEVPNKRQIYIPENLYVIGTVNMDETTYPFSKKVLDRANTIEFNRVELNHFDFLSDTEEFPAEQIHNRQFVSKYLGLKDVYENHPELVEEVSHELTLINKKLQLISAQVGYRVRDEICFYCIYSEEGKLMTKNEAIDYCILQKILPRIGGSDSRVEEVLDGLFTMFTGVKYNENVRLDDRVVKASRYTQSTKKIVEMIDKLDAGFTSFWIS